MLNISSVTLIKVFAVLLAICSLLACSNPATKVTYYETHDNCKMMRFLDSTMVVNKLKFSNNADYNLAIALKMHHQCSASMCTYEIQNGKNAEMKELATSILKIDQKELQKLDSFISTFPVQQEVANAELKSDMNRLIDKMQHQADLQFINDDDDHDFGILLLPQRQCNLDLAQLISESSQNPVLIQIAESIQESDPINIELLQQWLVKDINANKLHP